MTGLLIINTIALVLLLIIITAIIIIHFLELSKANKKIKTLTKERDDARNEVSRYCGELKKRYGDKEKVGYDLGDRGEQK